MPVLEIPAPAALAIAEADEPASVVDEAVKELTKVPLVPIEVNRPLGSDDPEPCRM